MNVNMERSGSGKAIVFIHGAGGSVLNWYHQREYLQGSMEVVLIDLPGHGSSPGEGCRSVKDYRDLCRDSLGNAGISRFLLAGHSMGGAIAMSFALAYPEMTEGVVLVGTGVRLRVLPEILDGIKVDYETTVRRIVGHAYSEKTSPKTREEGVKEMLKCDAEVMYNDFYACDHFDLMGSIGALEVPTLILCGRDDRLTPPAYSEYMHRKIRGSSLVLVEDAGHMVMLEKPQAVNKAIKEFAFQAGTVRPPE
jgi:pimeloyl-ACP methyl ester carboxylesterase